jgi:hypothetical protein
MSDFEKKMQELDFDLDSGYSALFCTEPCMAEEYGMNLKRIWAFGLKRSVFVKSYRVEMQCYYYA